MRRHDDTRPASTARPSTGTRSREEIRQALEAEAARFDADVAGAWTKQQRRIQADRFRRPVGLVGAAAALVTVAVAVPLGVQHLAERGSTIGATSTGTPTTEVTPGLQPGGDATDYGVWHAQVEVGAPLLFYVTLKQASVAATVPSEVLTVAAGDIFGTSVITTAHPSVVPSPSTGGELSGWEVLIGTVASGAASVYGVDGAGVHHSASLLTGVASTGVDGASGTVYLIPLTPSAPIAQVVALDSTGTIIGTAPSQPVR